MLLRKEQGGAIVAGYEWANDGDVVDVPGDLGLELLAIKGGGFTEVLPQPEPEPEPESDEDGHDEGGDAADSSPKPRRGRPPKTPVSE
jgi:hypothetical protein